VIDDSHHVRIIDFGSARSVPSVACNDASSGSEESSSNDDHDTNDDCDFRVTTQTQGRDQQQPKKRRRESASPREAADDLKAVMQDGKNTTLTEDAVLPGAAGGLMSALVVTLTYRAPEIECNLQELRQSKCHAHDFNTLYGQPVDIWSVGLVFSELLSCACGTNSRGVRHLFASSTRRTSDEAADGKSILQFIESIYNPNRRGFIDHHYKDMTAVMGLPDALDLLEQMLRVDWQVCTGIGPANLWICPGAYELHDFVWYFSF
jgi:serine/threonine protein kinase